MTSGNHDDQVAGNIWCFMGFVQPARFGALRALGLLLADGAPTVHYAAIPM